MDDDLASLHLQCAAIVIPLQSAFGIGFEFWDAAQTFNSSGPFGIEHRRNGRIEHERMPSIWSVSHMPMALPVQRATQNTDAINQTTADMNANMDTITTRLDQLVDKVDTLEWSDTNDNRASLQGNCTVVRRTVFEPEEDEETLNVLTTVDPFASIKNDQILNSSRDSVEEGNEMVRIGSNHREINFLNLEQTEVEANEIGVAVQNVFIVAELDMLLIVVETGDPIFKEMAHHLTLTELLIMPQ
ncbi:hypothetical protein niasHT_022414 [Heterodera trifolii]|uniref:Uncharacterized protein n=1 Tax=Heterodera trifolii TaxID=157864 RepID=A0ABD2KN97_9BILA